jgi:CheY-like chemotaxis protein
MITGFGRDELKRRMQEEGGSVGAVLAKPVTPSNLLDACQAALGRAAGAARRAMPRDEALLEHQAALRGAHLLLVEDNAVNQELARALLGRAGIAVTVAEDGRQAIDLLAREVFDGVLMDCQMPNLDGYAATALLREQERFRELPIIAMTANAMVGDREKALAAGMNDQIAKPIKVEEMFATLARWIRPASAAGVASAPAAQLAVLGALPGLDISRWIDNGMGDLALYRRLLVLFMKEQQAFPAPMQAALDAGDLPTLRRLAHSLRSVAATLGAPAVERAARALEDAGAAGAPPGTLQPLLDALAAQLGPLLAALRELPAVRA